ncbi:hypothetical protein WA577_006312, partial [Blastocystis sp. JDR]
MGSSEGFIHTGLSLMKTAEEVKQYLKEPSTDPFIPFDIEDPQGRIHSIRHVRENQLVDECGEWAVVVDVKERWMKAVKHKWLDSPHTLYGVMITKKYAVEHNRVLDLSDDGDRWDGDVMWNQPFGWGVLYDSENRKAYEGFRIGDMNVCYGARYYSDIQKVEYEGEWYEGVRSGHGIQYNRSGEVMYDGYWMNNKHMQTSVFMKERKLFHNFITTLKIEGPWTKKECLSKSFFSMLPDLEVLITGDLCFNNQIDLTIMGMNNLKRIVIGNKCFKVWYYYYGRPENCFRVVDCPQLRSIEIGNRSFYKCG